MDPNRHQIVGKIWENHDQPLDHWIWRYPWVPCFQTRRKMMISFIGIEIDQFWGDMLG